ncbi:OpgC domain-containing protein [Rhodobacter sp. Har01]|uniref:OpgC family protein n=1 Tax=Rhodobacter sp. Har01 TaxID=2883999 RepID=UPI001D087576|nr:OpgC domain-containing protein [Rhodobacter sp. Har01]MCB6176766.1 OpgC domain-containing protein [Rhodobacter sp. Har01]
MSASPAAMATATDTAKKPRDLRLDFFRGVAMIVILVAHITDNPFALWIPGRFGFSDSAEIFVFCSGMASALAFGPVFLRSGWAIGAARVFYRVWQVYWVHIGVFLVTLALMLSLQATGLFPRDVVSGLNLKPFLNETGPNLLGLLTLTYVPNYFDILPMYIVILALLPGFMALARIDRRLAMAASLALWAYATMGGLGLPAEAWFENGSTREWFFNPFAWQLVFVSGFALMAGWVPAPPVRRDLVWLALAVVVLTVPFAWHVTLGASEALREWRRDWLVLHDKTHLGALRYVHFLALAYLAWVAVGPRGQRLTQGQRRVPLVQAVALIGRQSLAVFAVSMVIARGLGALLDLSGRDFLPTLAVNLLGLAILYATAWLVGWIKSGPWAATAKPVSGATAAPRAKVRPEAAASVGPVTKPEVWG